jgi:hypothetical protein
MDTHPMKMTDADRLEWLENFFFRRWVSPLNKTSMWEVVGHSNNILKWMESGTNLREAIDAAALEQETRRASTQ